MSANHASCTSACVGESSVPRWAPWALFVAFIIAACSGIFSFGVQDNNEGLYATIAKEMLATGQWVVPHLNGVAYLEKPPLLYWMVAISLSVFGHNEVAVRLVPAFFMGLTLLGLLQLLRQMGRPRTGYMAAAMLVSTGGFVVMSRSLLFDVPMTSFLIWSLVFFHAYRLRESRRMLWLFYVCLALAVMAKGPTALVLGGGCAVIATLFTERSLRAVLRVFDPVGILIFFLIVTPWHIMAELRHPGFAHFYFVNEHVLRFLNLRQPQDYYSGPFYYYVMRLPLYLGLWTLFLPLLLWRRSKKNAAGGAPAEPVAATSAERQGQVLLWVAVLLPLVFFSVSRAKANYYWLPSIPALIALLALNWPAAVNAWRGTRWLSWVMKGLTGLAVVAFVALPLIPYFVAIPEPWGSFVESWRVLLTMLLLLAAAVIGLWSLRRIGPQVTFLCICAGGLVPWLAAPRALSIAEAEISNRQVAQFLSSEPAGAVVFFRDYEYMSSLGFYLKEPVPILNSWSNDLYYAQHLGCYPQVFINSDEFKQRASSGYVYLVMRNSSRGIVTSEFGAEGFHEVQRFRRLTVFSNAPSSLQPLAKAPQTTIVPVQAIQSVAVSNGAN